MALKGWLWQFEIGAGSFKRSWFCDEAVDDETDVGIRMKDNNLGCLLFSLFY